METEVQLLELLITAESKTRTAFADLIGMSRQNINYLIRKAEKNNGKLNEDFKQLLQEHGLDLYKFKRNPTNDFYPNTLEPKVNMEKKIIELLEKEIDLLRTIANLKEENVELKTIIGTEKKQSRRRSA
jgi:hypothetical protein